MLKITDPDNFRRTLTGLCMFAAPIALLAALVVHPGEGEGGLVQSLAANPGRTDAANLLIILSSVLFVPALIGLLGLMRDRGVALGHIGVALMVIGVIGHAVWAGFQIVLAGMATSGIDLVQLSAIVDDGPPPGFGFIVVMLMFLAASFFGVLTLAAGLWRSGVVPRWVPVCLALAPLTDMIPLPGGSILQVVGPGLLLVAFGTIGFKVLGTTDGEWSPKQSSAATDVGMTAQA